jgi:hypothetical protein
MKHLGQSIILLLLLTACGFQPLEGRSYRESNATNISMVQIETARDHYPQLLKAEIEDQINPDYQHVEKLYRMNITFTETDIALFINPDGTSSRGDFQYSSKYTLTRIADSKVITSGTMMRVSSYNTSLNADYASYVSREDARKRGILELAQDYKLRLANLISTLNHPNATQPTVPVAKPEDAPIIHTPYDYETHSQGF